MQTSKQARAGRVARAPELQRSPLRALCRWWERPTNRTRIRRAVKGARVGAERQAWLRRSAQSGERDSHDKYRCQNKR